MQWRRPSGQEMHSNQLWLPLLLWQQRWHKKHHSQERNWCKGCQIGATVRWLVDVSLSTTKPAHPHVNGRAALPLCDYEYSFRRRWHDSKFLEKLLFISFPYLEELVWNVQCLLRLTTLCRALACNVCHVQSTTRFLPETFHIKLKAYCVERDLSYIRD